MVFPTYKFINFYVDKLFHLIYCPLNDAITFSNVIVIIFFYTVACGTVLWLMEVI